MQLHGSKHRPGCGTAVTAGVQLGTETKVVDGAETELDHGGRWGSLSWTELWHELNHLFVPYLLIAAMWRCADGEMRQRNSASSGPAHLSVVRTRVVLRPQSLDFSHSGTELSHLAVHETPCIWGQPFLSTPIHLTTAPHSPMRGAPKCFSHDLVEEPYFHWQQFHQVLLFFPQKMSSLLAMNKASNLSIFLLLLVIQLKVQILTSKPGPGKYEPPWTESFKYGTLSRISLL